MVTMDICYGCGYLKVTHATGGSRAMYYKCHHPKIGKGHSIYKLTKCPKDWFKEEKNNENRNIT